MPLLRYLLPQTLVGRVYVIFAAALALPIVVGFILFLLGEFAIGLDQQLRAAQTLAEVVAPLVREAASRGDIAQMQRTLLRLLESSPFAQATLIEASGQVFEVVRATSPLPSWIPQWVIQAVAASTADINMPIRSGPTVHGVLRMRYAPEPLANHLATVFAAASGLTLLALGAGVFALRVALRNWLTPLTRMRESAGLQGFGHSADGGIPLEIQQAINAFNHHELQLQTQRVTAEATLATVRDGVITLNALGQVLSLNPSAAAMLGSQDEPLVGISVHRLFPELFGGLGPPAPLGSWTTRRVEHHTRRLNGRSCALDTSLLPLHDEAGKMIGHVLSLRDLTESLEYEARLRSELDMRRQATLSLQETLSGLMPEAQELTLANADVKLESVTKLMANLVRQREIDRRALDFQKFALDQHAAVSIADANGAIVYTNAKLIEMSGYSADELMGRRHDVFTSGHHPPEFFAALWQEIFSGRPWHGPIVDRRKDGTLFWTATTIVPHLDETGKLQQYVVIRTDISAQKRIERELKEAHAREISTGREIQRTLLIGDSPRNLVGADVASYNRPSLGIDGDFFSISKAGPHGFELLIGDVMGKGVPAALVGAAVRTTYSRVVAELMAASSTPSSLPAPQAIVNTMHEQMTQRLIELDTFVTLALYRFDSAAERVTYVNAGHTPGLLLRTGQPARRLLGNNLPLGVSNVEVYQQLECDWRQGDCLLAYSDGITEARNEEGQEFGEADLISKAAELAASGAPCSVALEVLRKHLANHVGRALKIDDETAVLARATGLNPALSRAAALRPLTDATLVLRWQLSELSKLRGWLAKVACDLQLNAGTTSKVLLACFEAASNVLRHAPQVFVDATLTCRFVQKAGGPVVELWHQGNVFEPVRECLVSFGTSWNPDLANLGEGGFGLSIIHQLASQVQYLQASSDLCCTSLMFGETVLLPQSPDSEVDTGAGDGSAAYALPVLEPAGLAH